MARPPLNDALWALLALLIPQGRGKVAIGTAGRESPTGPLSTGISYVLRSGVPSQLLPWGWGAGPAARRQRAGVWRRLETL